MAGWGGGRENQRAFVNTDAVKAEAAPVPGRVLRGLVAPVEALRIEYVIDLRVLATAQAADAPIRNHREGWGAWGREQCLGR